jgi:hypothetical protein
MALYDAFGNEIKEGCKIAYIESTGSGDVRLRKGQVIRLTNEKMISQDTGPIMVILVKVEGIKRMWNRQFHAFEVSSFYYQIMLSPSKNICVLSYPLDEKVRLCRDESRSEMHATCKPTAPSMNLD